VMFRQKRILNTSALASEAPTKGAEAEPPEERLKALCGLFASR
jgi:hypothetical protein